ncbi:MAG: serine protease [Proteobacteria bacterium]|nr:serine protease [Pseudomonadota bacterium]
MTETSGWAFPDAYQPQADDVAFDIDRVTSSVVRLKAEVPDDAFTAPMLGTERAGNGIVIGDTGLVLTIGYLVTEAQSIWLTTEKGGVVPAYPLLYDFASGFGLVQAMAPLGLPALPLGSAVDVDAGDEIVVVGFGGRPHALKAQLFAKREFAGYWEYVLDEALFTTPAHPEWSGAALVDRRGRLVGVGSLFVQEQHDDEAVQGNMFVPIDLVSPLLADVAAGGSARPARPWLGLYAADETEGLVVNGIARAAPADRAGVKPGDVVVAVGGVPVQGLAELFRSVWRTGPAGAPVDLTLMRDGKRVDVQVQSADRASFLKKPSLQ